MRKSLSIVGTGYSERVDLARNLIEMGYNVDVVGRGWPEEFKPSPPVDRLALIEKLKTDCGCVLNMPHHQMKNTLNPFFFDLAAAAIPQIVVPRPKVTYPGVPPFVALQTVEQYQPSVIDEARRASVPLQNNILENHTIDQRIEEMLS